MNEPSSDIFLDLKTLSKRSCISVRSLRGDIRDPDNPLPCFKKGGKVYVRWSEFVQWMDGFRHVAEDKEATINERVKRLASRVS